MLTHVISLCNGPIANFAGLRLRGKRKLSFDNSGHGECGIDHNVAALPFAYIVIVCYTEVFFMKTVASLFYFISSFIPPDKKGSYLYRKCFVLGGNYSVMCQNKALYIVVLLTVASHIGCTL
jgi:hypothetical protein